jgi:hypothetical protein
MEEEERSQVSSTGGSFELLHEIEELEVHDLDDNLDDNASLSLALSDDESRLSLSISAKRGQGESILDNNEADAALVAECQKELVLKDTEIEQLRFKLKMLERKAGEAETEVEEVVAQMIVDMQQKFTRQMNLTIRGYESKLKAEIDSKKAALTRFTDRARQLEGQLELDKMEHAKQHSHERRALEEEVGELRRQHKLQMRQATDRYDSMFADEKKRWEDELEWQLQQQKSGQEEYLLLNEQQHMTQVEELKGLLAVNQATHHRQAQELTFMKKSATDVQAHKNMLGMEYEAKLRKASLTNAAKMKKQKMLYEQLLDHERGKLKIEREKMRARYQFLSMHVRAELEREALLEQAKAFEAHHAGRGRVVRRGRGQSTSS